MDGPAHGELARPPLRAREHPVPLTIGGGFGLYLNRMRLDETHDRTLFSQLPMPRATNDLDLFIRADVLCDFGSIRFFNPSFPWASLSPCLPKCSASDD